MEEYQNDASHFLLPTLARSKALFSGERRAAKGEAIECKSVSILKVSFFHFLLICQNICWCMSFESLTCVCVRLLPLLILLTATHKTRSQCQSFHASEIGSFIAHSLAPITNVDFKFISILFLAHQAPLNYYLSLSISQ